MDTLCNEDLAYLMEYEASLAYADYQATSLPTNISRRDYENCRFDSDDFLVKVVSNDSIDACHWIDTHGDLVNWRVKFEDRYFQFIGVRDLSADSILQTLKHYDEIDD